jgi:putative transposase
LSGGVITSMCRYAGMSRQAYYKEHRERERTCFDDAGIIGAVMNIRKMHPMLGTRKLQHMLKKQGHSVGRDRLFELLGEHNLLIPRKRRFVRTTDSRHRFRTYRNIISDMSVEKPNEVWVSDITYIHAGERFMYLSLITDLYSRKIVGYQLHDSLETLGCIEALKMALGQLSASDSPIHHSDRGCQYCSDAYTGLLRENGLRISMTQDGNCYENATAERVNGILKYEYNLGAKFPSREVAIEACSDGIQLYNEYRPHLSLGMRTPSEVHGGHRELSELFLESEPFLPENCAIPPGGSQGTLRSTALTTTVRYG